MPVVTGDVRLKQLESLFLSGPVQAKNQCFSIETLIDVLLALYNECCKSSLRRERTVADFIQYGSYFFIFSSGGRTICISVTMTILKMVAK